MEATEKFNFPLMKLEEIIEILNKLGFKVDKTVIESEDSDQIVELYCSVFDKIGILRKDKLNMSFEAMKSFVYTGMHDRPLYILKLFNKIKPFIIDVLGIESFSSEDLFKPQPKRNKRILSGLLKFYKFKQSKLDIYTNLKKNLDNSILQVKDKVNKHERVFGHYTKIK